MKSEARRMMPFLVCLALAWLPNRMGAEERGGLSASDIEFMKEAARAGMFEVQAGELARSKGSSQAVKDFGERMVTDHGKANEDLKELAQRKGVDLPSSIADEHQEHLNRLNQLSGKEFDREFMEMMVEDHQADLKKFQSAAEGADDSELKAFASRVAGVIEQHLDSSRQLQAEMSSGQQQEPSSESNRSSGSSGSTRSGDEGSATNRKGTERDRSGTSAGSETSRQGSQRRQGGDRD